MFFLIDYDRAQGKIISLKTFLESESKVAQADRLSVELDHVRNGIRREVVLLDAKSEEALRRTHRRYFETLSELVEVN